jgi:hypothetical protein
MSGDDPSLLRHGRDEGVGHAHHQRLARHRRGLLLAEGINPSAGGVGDLEALKQVSLAVEQRVKGHLVQQPMRHDHQLPR